MTDDPQNNPSETPENPETHLPDASVVSDLPIAGPPRAVEEEAPQPQEPLKLLSPHDPGLRLTQAGYGHAETGIHLSSKKRWFYIGIAVAILNPLFSGLVLGILFWKEPEMKREGRIITIISLVWGIVMLVLAYKLRALSQ